MVRACNHDLRIGKPIGDLREGFNQNFWTLISSPLSKCQNSMLRIPTLANVRKFGRSGKNAMLPQMDVLAAVGLQQHLPIRRQQYRQRSREQHQLRRNRAKQLVQLWESCALGKIDEFDDVM